LSISAMNKPKNKALTVYLAASVALAAFDNIYAVFGHGVRSAWMGWAFACPLAGGALWACLSAFVDAKGRRFAFNAYNSGLAAVTAGMLYKGIVYIAGADDLWGSQFIAFGILAASIGAAALFVSGR